MSGSGGCNTFGGPMTKTRDGLRIGPLMVTQRACLDDELNQFEARFLGALERVRTARSSGGQLVLTANNGEALVFRPTLR